MCVTQLFLNQMTGFTSGKSRSRDSSKASSGRGDSRERSNSILDTILKRGRSASQGSQTSSRQESMERGGSETGGNCPAVASHKTAEFGESEENFNIGTASDPGKSTFFSRIGKKKKLEIKPTDFDDLFARGHALSAQLEETQQPNGVNYSTSKNEPQQTTVFGTQSSSSSHGPSQPPTPFAMFSQEEAFKQSQQEAGLSYEEKVQSYLDDQQLTTAPFMQQHPMDHDDVTSNNEQYKSGNEKQHRSRSRKKPSTQDQPLNIQQQPLDKKPASYANPEDVRIDQTNSEDVMSSASLPAQGGGGVLSGTNMAVTSYNRLRMTKGDPAGEDVTQRGRSESGASSKRRQMTPEEFLKNLGEFVKKAEVDQQYAQPVWPAIVLSPNDLPPTKQPQTHPEINRNLLPEPTTKRSPRPVSPIDKTFQDPGKKPRPISPYGVAAELRPSDQERSPSPYGQKSASYLHPKQSNIPTIYQQSPSPLPGSGPPMQRIAPSPGKSYLDQPSSLSPDPFQSRIEEQTSIDGTIPLPPLPSSNSAIETSSSILADLTKRTAQQYGLPESENEYDGQPQPLPSPRRGRSPNKISQVEQQPRIPAGDAHIPLQLKPDPLTAHELQTYDQPQQLRIAYPNEEVDAKKEDYSKPSIRDTDLYRKLQEGLSNIDKLVQSETFKDEITRSGADYRKYSHHLGRAEFGVLKKRSSLGNLNSIGGAPSTFDKVDSATMSDANNLGGASIQQSASATQLMGRTRFGGGVIGTSESSREPSKERPDSALGVTRTGSGVTSLAEPRTATATATTPSHGGKRTSKQSSRDSSLGRPDSRLSDNIPDLETEEQPFTGFGGGGAVKRTGSSSSRGIGGDSARKPHLTDADDDEERRLQDRLDIKPHPEIYEKRQEVLQEMAAQKQTVKEAKGKKNHFPFEFKLLFNKQHFFAR